VEEFPVTKLKIVGDIIQDVTDPILVPQSSLDHVAESAGADNQDEMVEDGESGDDCKEE